MSMFTILTSLCDRRPLPLEVMIDQLVLCALAFTQAQSSAFKCSLLALATPDTALLALA